VRAKESSGVLERAANTTGWKGSRITELESTIRIVSGEKLPPFRKGAMFLFKRTARKSAGTKLLANKGKENVEQERGEIIR